MLTTIFFDIGGVLLTDGWGHESRRAAAERFELDWEDYADRHERVGHQIETNQMTLDQYLERTIFCRPRDFSREEFRDFVFAQSVAKPDSLAIVAELAASQDYFLATINNEILELNVYRLEHFELGRYFSAFFSSCFLRVRKPDEAIYRTALQVTSVRRANACS
jgi:putative hydrolase of the HAD superfamily